ncbi:MAG: hypothetical protein ABL869_03755 [Candidatus Nitrotoga sp.]
MDFQDRAREAENKVYSEKHRVDKSRKDSQKHAEAAFDRLKKQIGNPPHIHIRLYEAEERSKYVYFPPIIQVSFYIEKRKLFSKTMEHFESLLIKICDRDGQVWFLDETKIPGDKFIEPKTYTKFDSSDFEELVGYIASKYGTWKAKYAGSK